MKQDNNDMIMIINNELENTRLSFGHTDLVKEIVQSLDNKSLDDELEYLLLSDSLDSSFIGTLLHKCIDKTMISFFGNVIPRHACYHIPVVSFG